MSTFCEAGPGAPPRQVDLVRFIAAIWAAVSPALAASYLNWAEYLTWRDPRIRSYDQYLLIDPPRGM